jgi:ribosomal protein S19E (S16A)
VYLRQKLGVGGLRKNYGGKNKRKVWAIMPDTTAKTLEEQEDCFDCVLQLFIHTFASYRCCGNIG